MLESFLVASRFAHFAASMLAFGAALFPLYAGTEPRSPMRLMTGLALLSGMVWLCCVLIGVAPDPANAFAPDEIRLVLFETSFGSAWLIHLVSGIGLAMAAAFGSRIGTMALSALNIVSLGMIGHAAVGEGLEQILRPAVNTVHLVAGAVWLGGLIPLWRALQAAEPGLRRKLVNRFSIVGYGVVALVIVSGFLNFFLITAAPIPSTSTSYDRLLLIKLGLVGLLLLTALVNQFYSTRRERWASLRGGIFVELAVFAGVVAVVSLMGVTPPM